MIAVTASLASVVATGALSAVTAISTATASHAAVTTPPAVTDINPNNSTRQLFGGRIEQLALDPVNHQRMFAASELGGFWMTTDGAANWRHIDAIPIFRGQGVAVAPTDPNLVVAVGNNVGEAVSRGSVWISHDGGNTWSGVTAADENNACNTEKNSYSVAIGSSNSATTIPIFVGNDCGLRASLDSGTTWSAQDPDGAFDNGLGQGHSIDSILVRGTAAPYSVDVCGQQGFFRSTDTGGTWSAADANSPTFRTNPPEGSGSGATSGGAFGPCSIAVAPNDPNTVYLANFQGGTTGGFCHSELLESTTGGTAGSWTRMNFDVSDNNCRDAFVRVQDNPDNDATTYDVYFGSDVRILRQTCDSDNTPTCNQSSGSWPQWDGNSPHTDPADIAFDNSIPGGCPLFISGDGGVFKATNSGCGGSPAFTNANVGMHAFDASQMAGTVWPGAGGHTDLYFVTQDNGTWYTGNGGTDYANEGPDSYDINADLVGNGSASVLRRDCFGCGVNRKNPGTPSPPSFGGGAGFSAPPDPGSAFPNEYVMAQFGPSSYISLMPNVAFNVSPPAPQTWNAYVTTDAGSNWSQFGNSLPAAPSPAGRPGPAQNGAVQASGPAGNPTFYLNLGGGLNRLSGPLPPSPPTAAPATLTPINTGLESVGPWAVDPSNPSLLYAASRGATKNGMYRSTNGGQSWQLDSTLTSLVTGGGTYKWNSNTWGFQVTGVGFDPDTDTVLVGTRSNGIYASVDNGNSWIYLRGSRERITWARNFFFDANNAYVSSRGHGLWKINVPKSNLAITKTDSPDPATAGTQLKYTLNVTNNGPDVSSAVTVTDTLPVEVDYVTSSIPCTVGGPGNKTVSCAIADLANGDSTTFTITTFVHADADVGHNGPFTATNTATVSSAETLDVDTSDNTATATTVINESADLEVTKLCNPDTTSATTSSGPGSTPAHCTIFVDNHGPSVARNIVLSDTMLSTLPFQISNISSPNASPPNCPVATVTGGKRIDCSQASLGAETAGVPGRMTLDYDVTAQDAQQIDNKARARSDTPDPDDTNNITDVTITVTGVANLRLTKTDTTGGSVDAGTSFTYNLQAFNDGPSQASNLVISDVVPAGVTINSVSGPTATACNVGVPGDPARPTTCSFGPVPSGQFRSMAIVVTVKPDTTGTLHNDAGVSSDTFDNDTSDNLVHLDTTVTTHADLRVTNVDTPDPVIAGRPLTHTITITNDGPSTARNVTLTDDMSAWEVLSGTTIQHGSGTCALITDTPHDVVGCQLGDLGPNDYVVVVVNGVVKSGAPAGAHMLDTATVGSSTSDPDSSDNAAQADTTVATSADLSITHSSEASTYKASTTIHYVITLANAGPSDAVNVVVKDALPPAKFGNYVSNDRGCTFSSTTQTLTCPGFTLPAGSTWILHVNFFVQGSKGTVQATASVTSSTPDPNTANNSATRTVTRK